VIRYQGILHASVLVADLDASLNFYRDTLGMIVDPSRPELGYPGAWLAVGDQQIHLLQCPNPDAGIRRPAHGGRDRHTAITVSDLDALSARLEAAGIAFSRSRSGRAALFCRDPDDNTLELVQA